MRQDYLQACYLSQMAILYLTGRQEFDLTGKLADPFKEEKGRYLFYNKL